MPVSNLRFFKRCAEWLPRSEIRTIPKNTRGIYTLLKKTGKDKYQVLYVGMSGGNKAHGIHYRLSSHTKSKRKNKTKWDYFSFFEVWDNIPFSEVKELEGLIRHIYRKDKTVNILNRQRRFKKFIDVRDNKLKNWKSK